MNLQCPNCGTVYDVTDYESGHRFTCTCGEALEVEHPRPPGATASPSAPGPTEAPGLQRPLKLIVFFGNLCGAPFVPLVALIGWLTLRDDSPAVADDVCKMTWIPFVIWIVLAGLYIVFAVSMGVLGSLGEGF